MDWRMMGRAEHDPAVGEQTCQFAVSSNRSSCDVFMSMKYAWRIAVTNVIASLLMRNLAEALNQETELQTLIVFTIALH